jgi:hypothetical protein
MKHAQRPDKTSMVCPSCKKDNCANCVDVLRAIYAEEMICKCTRQGHSGEAVDKQIADPFTGSVFGPHAVITEDGRVTTDEEFKRQWREQFGDY